MKNQKVVSITDSGQLTVPADFRRKLHIKGKTKAVVKMKDNHFLVKPQLSFDQLSGSLKSKVKLSDKQLSQARDAFQKEWANE